MNTESQEADAVEEQQIRAAVVRFYDALETLVRGGGTEKMNEAWHHTPRVTAMHPMGDIQYGWDEIRITWEELGANARDDAGGSSIRELRVHRYGGDLAYTTCVFVAGPKFDHVEVNCTNVVHKANGVWKLVHHHADRQQVIESVALQMAEEAATSG